MGNGLWRGVIVNSLANTLEVLELGEWLQTNETDDNSFEYIKVDPKKWMMRKLRSTTWIRFWNCWHVWIWALDSLMLLGKLVFLVFSFLLWFLGIQGSSQLADIPACVRAEFSWLRQLISAKSRPNSRGLATEQHSDDVDVYMCSIR